MSRAAVWVVLGGLAACAEGGVAGTELRPPPEMDMRAQPPTPPPDARPSVDAQRLDVGPAPDVAVDASPDVLTDGLLSDASFSDGPSIDVPHLDEGVAVDAADLPDPDAALPDAAPPEPDMGMCPEELCNGLDDDCDDQVDEGPVCGPWVQTQCRLYAGWSDRDRNPRGIAPAWGPCPPQDRSFADRDLHCVGTRGDGRFARLQLGGDVNEDDALGVALRCEDAANPELAAYVQSHCALFLGWADGNRGSDGAVVWGACPNSVASNVGQLRCTSTGYDGNFRALDLDGDVDENDDLAVAWRCQDDMDPARAAALQAHVDVFMGWADENRAPPDTAAVWGVCPAQAGGVAARQYCNSTRGDGRFHKLDLDGDVDENDALGFSVRAR